MNGSLKNLDIQMPEVPPLTSAQPIGNKPVCDPGDAGSSPTPGSNPAWDILSSNGEVLDH